MRRRGKQLRCVVCGGSFVRRGREVTCQAKACREQRRLEAARERSRRHHAAHRHERNERNRLDPRRPIYEARRKAKRRAKGKAGACPQGGGR